MSRLPFDRGIFWKVFLVVMGLLVLTFYLLFKFTGYQLTNPDRYGSLISATILSYLVHLWLLPAEYEEDYEDANDDGFGGESEPGDVVTDQGEDADSESKQG